MRLSYRLAWCAVLIAVLVVAGCGETSGPGRAAVSAELSSALLRADQFPAGTMVRRRDWSHYGHQLAEQLPITTYTPAQCKAPREKQAALEQAQPNHVGVYATVATPHLMYNNSAARDAGSIELFRQMAAGPCATVRQVRHSNGNVYDTTTLTTTVLPSPTIPHAGEILFLEQRSQIDDLIDPELGSISFSLYAFVSMPDDVVITLSQEASSENMLDRRQFLTLLGDSVSNYQKRS